MQKRRFTYKKGVIFLLVFCFFLALAVYIANFFFENNNRVIKDGNSGYENSYSLKCGYITCDSSISYCETKMSDITSIPNTYSCQPLPNSCKNKTNSEASCGCFPENTACDFCSIDTDNGKPVFWRTCVGGK